MSAMDPRKVLGNRGEDLAAEFFIAKGFDVVERNWRKRIGELDLVIRKGDEFRFVEVKTRYSLAAGYPEESVTLLKLKKFEQIALDYLESNPGLPEDFHMDVLSLIVDGTGNVDYRYLPDIGVS